MTKLFKKRRLTNLDGFAVGITAAGVTFAIKNAFVQPQIDIPSAIVIATIFALLLVGLIVSFIAKFKKRSALSPFADGILEGFGALFATLTFAQALITGDLQSSIGV